MGRLSPSLVHWTRAMVKVAIKVKLERARAMCERCARVRGVDVADEEAEDEGGTNVGRVAEGGSDIVGRKIQAKRIKFSIQRTSSTYNNSFKPCFLLKFTCQFFHSTPFEYQIIPSHPFIFHCTIVFSHIIVYYPSLTLPW